MLFYEVRHFSPKIVFYALKFVCGYFYWLENNICKKNPALLAQKLGRKKILSKSLSGYSKTKKEKNKKKWHEPLSH